LSKLRNCLIAAGFAAKQWVSEHLSLYRFAVVAKIVESTYVSPPRPPPAGPRLSAIRARREMARARIFAHHGCSKMLRRSRGHTPEGTVTSWSQMEEDMFGYKAANIIGKPTATLFPTHPNQCWQRIAEDGTPCASIISIAGRCVRAAGGCSAAPAGHSIRRRCAATAS
jgi:PAS domain-containing protein